MSKVTDLDIVYAGRIKAMRKANPDASLAKVAQFLGITYQSYQAIEGGKVSIRLSTLHRLASFYGVPVTAFDGDTVEFFPNMDKISYILPLLKEMSPASAAEVVRFAVATARSEASGA